MTAMEAKQLIETALKERNVPFTRVSASKLLFENVICTKKRFVKIHGWQPNPIFNEIQKIANENGFCVTTDWEIN